LCSSSPLTARCPRLRLQNGGRAAQLPANHRVRALVAGGSSAAQAVIRFRPTEPVRLVLRETRISAHRWAASGCRMQQRPQGANVIADGRLKCWARFSSYDAAFRVCVSCDGREFAVAIRRRLQNILSSRSARSASAYRSQAHASNAAARCGALTAMNTLVRRFRGARDGARWLPGQSEILCELGGNLAHFGKRHRFIRFVVQVQSAPAVRLITHAAIERNDGAVSAGADVID